MVLINEIIPRQAFEIVTVRIGSILLEELTNQFQLQAIPETLSVYIESQRPYDPTEGTVVNVSCQNTSYTIENQHSAQGVVNYTVDVYCGNEETIDKTGSDNARFKIQRIAGMIRYILQSTKYQTLDFDLGLIGNKKVETIQFPDRYEADTSFFRFARVTLSVNLIENQKAWDGLSMFGNDTVMKLDHTDKGHKIIFNN